MTPEFAHLVEVKIETIAAQIDAGLHEDGWAKGPDYICEQAADEPVDVPGWLRGLDLYPKPDGAEELIALIASDAGTLFEAIGRLRGMYRGQG